MTEVFKESFQLMSEIDYSYDPAVFVKCKECVCQYPFGTDRIGTRISGDARQPFLIGIGRIKQFAPVDDFFSAVEEFLSERQCIVLFETYTIFLLI